MNYNQFKILVFLEKNNKNTKNSQRDISKSLNISLGTVNKVINDLKKINLIDEELFLTKAGLEALEPYRVKRAIFFAAGFGSRLRPITLNTPKPLVRVHNKRIIETLLDACVEAGIEDIVVVRGYLKDEFNILLNKYPNIKFVDNEFYSEQNNISSAYVAKDYLCNCYILESDLYLTDSNLIQKYEYNTNYLGKYVEKTDDWCFETKNKKIIRYKHGGNNCHHMYGVFHLTEEDSIKFKRDLEDFYNNVPGAKDCFYDDIALNYYKDKYDVVVRECEDGIVEIDSFNELKEIDSAYNI